MHDKSRRLVLFFIHFLSELRKTIRPVNWAHWVFGFSAETKYFRLKIFDYVILVNNGVTDYPLALQFVFVHPLKDE